MDACYSGVAFLRTPAGAGSERADPARAGSAGDSRGYQSAGLRWAHGRARSSCADSAISVASSP
jgi:hypothetical protein